MDPLRIYLLTGLIAHKAVWELLKRKAGPVSLPSPSLQVRLVKAAKIGVLCGIAAQTFLPDVFPISADASALRATGAALFTLGLLTAVSARIQLGRNWLDIESANVKSGQATVSKGIYGYIRHPIYTGDLLLLLGLELALNSWFVLGVAALAPIVLLQAVKEEQKLVARLPGYADYCGRTKRFIPFVA